MKLGKPHALRARASSAGKLILAYEFELVLEVSDMALIPAELDKAVAHINGLLRAKAALEQQVAALREELAAVAVTDPATDKAEAAFHNYIGALPDNPDYLNPAAPPAGATTGTGTATMTTAPMDVGDPGPHTLVLK